MEKITREWAARQMKCDCRKIRDSMPPEEWAIDRDLMFDNCAACQLREARKRLDIPNIGGWHIIAIADRWSLSEEQYESIVSAMEGDNYRYGDRIREAIAEFGIRIAPNHRAQLMAENIRNGNRKEVIAFLRDDMRQTEALSTLCYLLDSLDEYNRSVICRMLSDAWGFPHNDRPGRA